MLGQGGVVVNRSKTIELTVSGADMIGLCYPPPYRIGPAGGPSPCCHLSQWEAFLRYAQMSKAILLIYILRL